MESQPGRRGWTWYTGSGGLDVSGWQEEVLDFKLRGDRLSIEPAIPESWPGYTKTFRYGQTQYQIDVENGGQPSKQEIRLKDDHQNHTIHVTVGREDSQNVVDTSNTPSIVV